MPARKSGPRPRALAPGASWLAFMVIACLLMGSAAHASSWSYRKQITIDSGKVTADLTNFPVLISLTNDLELRTTADGGNVQDANGYDIVFRSSSGLKLDFEIEKYVSAAGGATLIAWVRIPSLSSTVDTDIYIYYGNPDISTSQENAAGVWDTHFLAVHHLEEDPTGTIDDSTANNQDMIGTRTDAADRVSAQIGDGFNFDAADTEYLTSTSTITIQPFTFSLWSDPQLIPDWDVLVNFDTAGANFRYFAIAPGFLLGYDGVGGLSYFGSGSECTENEWQHFVLTYDGTTLRAYRNGVQLGSPVAKAIPLRTDDFEVASYHNGTEAYDGVLDEVRISDMARSPDWIATEYNNQVSPSTFYLDGSEESGSWSFPRSYGYRKKITVDSTRVTADLTSYPLLVSLSNDVELRTIADGGRVEDGNGYDIVFRASDGTMLDFEIEEYTSTVAGATLVAWVRIPNLSSTIDTDIYLYYGNPDAACSQENPTGVWDTNYQAVWHLKEIPSGSGDIKDSTGTHHGTSVNMEAGDQTTGQIDGSLNFDGVNEDVSIPDHAEWSLSSGDTRTYEGWFNFSVLPGIGDWDTIVQDPNSGYAYQFTANFGGGLRLNWYDGSTDYYSPPISILAGEWHQYVLSLDFGVANGSHWYLDGVDQGAFTAPNAIQDPTELTLGGTTIIPSCYFTGALDEVRISNTARSTDWIQTEYNNVNIPTKDPACTDNGFVCLGSEEEGPWDFAWIYGYRKRLTVDPAKVSCGSDLSNFPLLVNLTDPDLRNRAFGGQVENANGYDIIFRESDGQNALDFEIEDYDATTGTLVAWVRVPTLYAASGTEIYMYYGNPEVACSRENASGVWDADYQAVWHLKEMGDGTPGEFKDSTSNANDGRGGAGTASYVPTQSTGKIGKAQFFDGLDDHISMANSSVLDITTSAITLEAWANFSVNPANPANPNPDWSGTLSKGGFSDGYRFVIDEDGLTGSIGFQLTSTSGYQVVSAATASENVWHHVVARYDGATMNVYIDGVEDVNFDTRAGAIDSSADVLVIGHGDDEIGQWYSYPFNGSIDEVRISDVARSACWIQTEYNNQSWPTKNSACSDDGFLCVDSEEVAPPTAVTLTSFTATGFDVGVLLEWETGSEMRNLGFHLYRATSVAGPYTRITSRAIPGLGSSPEGARYSYHDQGLTNGVTYYYKLEDIETTGKTEMHGPVSATPQSGAGVCCGESGGAAEDSRIMVGEPSSSRLRVLEQRPGEVVLILETGGFYAEPREDGTVELAIPGFVGATDEGFSLPVRRTWVDALAGRRVNLVSVETLEEEWFENLRPSYAGEPVVEATPRGTVRAARRRAPHQMPTNAGIYPEESARVVSVGYQGDVKKALVEMSPLRWVASAERLVLAHRLVVRLKFEGRDPADRVRNGTRGRRYRRRKSHERQDVRARLVTEEKGLYGIRFEEVFEPGSQPVVPVGSLRLSRHGNAVPFHLEPDSGWFGPGTTLYFISEGPQANPYGREAVYELAIGASGERMSVGTARPSGEPVWGYWETVEQEEDLLYQATLVDVPDRWLWSALFAQARKSFVFDVSALAPTGEVSHLSVWFQGTSDFPADPDHHVRLLVNGTLVVEASWDGKQAREVEAEIAPGLLREGANLLEVENVGDTEAEYSMVMLDRFRLIYPRLPHATGGRLEGSWSASGTADVTGLGPETVVVELTASGPVWLREAEPSASGLRFRVESGRRYMAVSSESILKATEIRRPLESGLKDTGHRVDYLVVGPQAFVEAGAALLEHRRSQGLRVKGVPLEEVFSEFGFGEQDPSAIKDFIAYAYHNWKVAPRYVVLLGDGTYDFKDHMRTGVVNRVPPLMVKTTYLETASDPSYAAVNGEDLLPDLAIGRFPVATVEELQQMIEKIIAWESSGYSHAGPVVMVTDNPDEAGDFVADSEELATTVLSSRQLSKIYLEELGTAATRREILQAFDRGASLMNYIGHGGIHLWADENILNIYDVKNLSAQAEQPILLTMNCLNGYFHFPYFDALAEALVKREDRGAIAAFSPSGLSSNDAAHVFHRVLLEELLDGEHDRLGDAVLAAQSAYAQSGALAEMIAIYHLFGDPALRLH